MSESEAEDVVDEEVTLPQDLPGAGNIKQQQSAVKLTEVITRINNEELFTLLTQHKKYSTIIKYWLMPCHCISLYL